MSQVLEPIPGPVPDDVPLDPVPVAAPRLARHRIVLTDGHEVGITIAGIVAAFVAPPHPYGPGHRGIDLAAPSGTEVHAPATGTIAWYRRTGTFAVWSQ